VRKAGERIRITAQLINAPDGSNLWSERYDRRMTDIFDIQDDISQAIEGKLDEAMAAYSQGMDRASVFALHLQNRIESMNYSDEVSSQSALR